MSVTKIFLIIILGAILLVLVWHNNYQEKRIDNLLIKLVLTGEILKEDIERNHARIRILKRSLKRMANNQPIFKRAG